MRKLKEYLSLNGWKEHLGLNECKENLEETNRELKDIGILIKRGLGFSYYGDKDGDEMTSGERARFIFDSNSLWFGDEKEYMTYLGRNKWPIGPCTIGLGQTRRRFDDTNLFS